MGERLTADDAGRPRRLVVHIGAMKTGTTYLQNLLDVNRERLGDQGWWVPQQRRVVPAVRELLALTDDARRGDPPAGSAAAPQWQSLMADARTRGGEHGTVISMEFLSYVEREHARDALAAVQGLDPHVLLTVRDAVRAIPSQWQSLSRNRHGLSWPEFARAARGSGRRPSRAGAKPFRRTQDIPRIVETWATAVPRERFSVVTVPGAQAPRDLLWSRFLGVLGVDPATTSTDAPFANPQLGYGSCELLRMVNKAGLSGERPSDYRRVVRRLARGHLLQLRDEQTRPRMDLTTARFAVGLNRRTLDLARRHATIVGDEADLPDTLAPDLELDPGRSPAQVPAAEVRRAALALWDGALALCAELSLDLPSELGGPLADDLEDAAAQLATVMGIAITGDVDHRVH